MQFVIAEATALDTKLPKEIGKADQFITLSPSLKRPIVAEQEVME